VNRRLLFGLVLSTTVANAAVMRHLILFVVDSAIALVTCLAYRSFQHTITYQKTFEGVSNHGFFNPTLNKC
jgi:DNA-binding transcriptional regulator of glucitol operon